MFYIVYIYMVYIVTDLAEKDVQRVIVDKEDELVKGAEEKKAMELLLGRKEQARRVKHIHDICNDWKDHKKILKQVWRKMMIL